MFKASILSRWGSGPPVPAAGGGGLCVPAGRVQRRCGAPESETLAPFSASSDSAASARTPTAAGPEAASGGASPAVRGQAGWTSVRGGGREVKAGRRDLAIVATLNPQQKRGFCSVKVGINTLWMLWSVTGRHNPLVSLASPPTLSWGSFTCCVRAAQAWMDFSVRANRSLLLVPPPTSRPLDSCRAAARCSIFSCRS